MHVADENVELRTAWAASVGMAENARTCRVHDGPCGLLVSKIFSETHEMKCQHEMASGRMCVGKAG